MSPIILQGCKQWSLLGLAVRVAVQEIPWCGRAARLVGGGVAVQPPGPDSLVSQDWRWCVVACCDTSACAPVSAGIGMSRCGVDESGAGGEQEREHSHSLC